MDPGEPQARRALRLPPSGQKEVLERQRIMHGGAGRVIEYPASAFDIENVHLKFTRGAPHAIACEALQVRCPRPACYHGKYYGGPDVRNSITAQYDGGNDLGGGCNPEGTAPVGLPEDRRNGLSRRSGTHGNAFPQRQKRQPRRLIQRDCSVAAAARTDCFSPRGLCDPCRTAEVD